MAQFDLDRFGNVMSRLLVIRQRNISVIFNTFLIIFLAFAMFRYTYVFWKDDR